MRRRHFCAPGVGHCLICHNQPGYRLLSLPDDQSELMMLLLKFIAVCAIALALMTFQWVWSYNDISRHRENMKEKIRDTEDNSDT